MGNSKIVYGGRALIDLTNDTVTAEKLKAGETAHDKAGNPIVGTLETGAYDVTSTDNGDGTQTLEIIDSSGSSGGSATIQPLTVTENGTYTVPEGVDGYSPVTVDVPSSGGFTPPAVGFVPSAWDSNGYITDGTWYGSTIPATAFGAPFKFSKLVFHDNVTSIGNNAFDGCTKLALTSLPSGVTSIGVRAFGTCVSLALTSLPSGMTSIESYTFYSCTKLALTSLPSGVTSIGNNAFYSCQSLALTSLPSGVTSIESYAFRYCQGLTTLTFEGTPTSIASNAFGNCNNLTAINVPWSEGEVANAPWGATNATINYNYTGV